MSVPAVFVHGIPDTHPVRDDLFARLEEIGSPVGLVGHDWAGALTVRAARSPLSKVWQTPGPTGRGHEGR